MGIALAFYAFIAIGIAEGGLGVLLPSIIATYELTPATVTALFFSQISGYFVAALTSSLLSHRIGLAQMVLLAAVSVTSALYIYASTTHWFVMVATGTLLGLGIGLIDAGINTFIAHDRRANLMGLLHAFYGIGALLGPAIATTLLASGINWRSAYGVFAAIVMLLVVGMIWVISQRQPLMPSPPSASEQSAGANLGLALKTPTVLIAGLLLLVYVGTEAALGSWAYAVQTIARGTPISVAGYSVTAYWLGLTIGRLSMGQVMKSIGAVRLIDYSLLLLTVGLLVWWLFPHQLWSLPLMGFALAAIFPTTIWLMPHRVPAAIVPAAIGFVTSLGSIGAVSIPTAIGWIGDRFGLGTIPMVMLPFALLMLVLHRGLVRITIAESTAEP
ncbi:MAG: MFS transporter [Oscillatoriophycideae cyanobacterium NC_groundwater_1537_Pr4_S-0.65um_50_18]|nr:MFS transporter [Oscillatoriophycideae cyanobacterium NC_groundwater_1537_Pr4_S-0.65um_50_18]